MNDGLNSDGLDNVLWCVQQIRTAGSGREIAGYVLRIPDAILFTHGAQLQAECVAGKFAAGAVFLRQREAILHAVRDAHGLIPEHLTLELESWRATLSFYAAGGMAQLPDFMGGARVANQV